MKIFFCIALTIILSGFPVAAATAAQNLEIWFVWANGYSGTATLIRGPNGTVVLYDEMGGAPGAGYLYDLLNELGITYIDYAIAGHYDGDHIGGLDDLYSLMGSQLSDFGHFYDRGGSEKDDGSSISSDYYDLVNPSGKRTTVKVDGTTDIDLGDGAIIRFLSVGAPNTTNALYIRGRPDVTSGISENNKSISALVTHGGFDLYLGSDLEGTGEQAVVDVIVDDLGRDPDICLVDHHGSESNGTSSAAFCAKMDPEVAVISVWSNGYGHPRRTTVENFQAAVEPEDQRILRLDPGDVGDGNWAPENMAYCHTTNRHIYVYTNGVNYTVDTVDREGGDDITEPGLINHYADEGYQLLITEVAVDAHQPLEYDWVELSMKLGMADLAEVYMTDRESVFPVAGNGTLTMTSGDVLIVHDTGGTSENDSSGRGANGLWDVYQSSLDLDAGDDQFIITTQNSTNPDGGNILDAVCWSNDDGTMVSGEVADGNNLISNNHWGDPVQGEGQFSTANQGPAIGDINNGYAQRLTFTDHNDVGDWEIAANDSHGGPPPSATPTTTPSPTPTVTPSITPTPSVTSTPTPSITPTPSTSPTPTPAPPEGDVVINEILADVPMGDAGDANNDGVRSSWEDEFVELVNWTDHTVDLGGCTISDDTAVRYTFPDSFEVPPGGAVVVFGGGTPTGDFGGADWVTVSDFCCGLYLSNYGDTVTLSDGVLIYDSVTYGEEGNNDQSLNRNPEKRGFFCLHSQIPESGGSLYSPGTKVNGDPFVYEPTPIPTPSATPSPTCTSTPSPSPTPSTTPLPTPAATSTVTPIPTPIPTVSPSPSKAPTPKPTATPPASPSPSRTPTPKPTATPTAAPSPSRSPTPNPTATPTASPFPSRTPTPSPPPTATPSHSRTPTPTPTCGPAVPLDHLMSESGDYDGDGTDDIAVFRPAETGDLWAIRGITRVYFGTAGDIPAAGDYAGTGRTEIGIFRSKSGLWAIRNVTRFYFGIEADLAVPGDYDGDGCCDPGIFRASGGLWAIREITRAYFGTTGDRPVPGDYTGSGAMTIGIFRPASGIWALRGTSRIYFGVSGDWPIPGDYTGDGTREAGIFRPATGLWAIRGSTRIYFGRCTDRPLPADYNGDRIDDCGLFRPPCGLWAAKGITRAYYGARGDIPVTR